MKEIRVKEYRKRKHRKRWITEEIKESEGVGYIYEISFDYVMNKWYLEEFKIQHHKDKPDDYWAGPIVYSDSRDDLIKQIEEVRGVKIII